MLFGIVVNIGKAKQDLINGKNNLKDIDLSFECTGYHTTVADTIKYAEVDVRGTIKSEYNKSGKTQDELLKQVIEGLEKYEAYEDDDIGVTIDIVDDNGEEVDHIWYSGTKKEIIEKIQSDFGIHESSIQDDGNDKKTEEVVTASGAEKVVSNQTNKEGKNIIPASEFKDVVKQQKTSGLKRKWNKFTHLMHKGANIRGNEVR